MGLVVVADLDLIASWKREAGANYMAEAKTVADTMVGTGN